MLKNAEIDSAKSNKIQCKNIGSTCVVCQNEVNKLGKKAFFSESFLVQATKKPINVESMLEHCKKSCQGIRLGHGYVQVESKCIHSAVA